MSVYTHFIKPFLTRNNTRGMLSYLQKVFHFIISESLFDDLGMWLNNLTHIDISVYFTFLFEDPTKRQKSKQNKWVQLCDTIVLHVIAFSFLWTNNVKTLVSFLNLQWSWPYVSDPQCLSSANQSAEWLKNNFGVFSRFASITDFYKLNQNFSGVNLEQLTGWNFIYNSKLKPLLHGEWFLLFCVLSSWRFFPSCLQTRQQRCCCCPSLLHQRKMLLSTECLTSCWSPLKTGSL